MTVFKPKYVPLTFFIFTVLLTYFPLKLSAQEISVNFISFYPSIPVSTSSLYITVVTTTQYSNVGLYVSPPDSTAVVPQFIQTINLYNTMYLWVYSIPNPNLGEYTFTFTRNNGVSTGITRKIIVGNTGLPVIPKRLIYGINPTWAEWVGRPLSYDSQMADLMYLAGAQCTRTGLDWDRLEPYQGVYDWYEYDRRMKLFIDRGIEIVGLISVSPPWATPNRPIHQWPPEEKYAVDFIKFCKSVGEHYRGKIKLFEFWNEANGFGWHSDNPAEYTKWLIRCYYGLKLGNPECLLSTTGIDGADTDFLYGMYMNGGKYFFDAVNLHPYNAQGPINFNGVNSIRTAMADYKDTAKPVWISEYGWDLNISPGQTQYLQQSLDTLVSGAYDYVTIASYHTISDFTKNQEIRMGLAEVNLSTRTSYLVFKNHPSIDTIPPLKPELKFPVNYTGVPSTAAVSFTWTEGLENKSYPVKYTFQVDDTTDFFSPEINFADLAVTTFTYTSTLTIATTYFWRVQATDSVGNVGNWSTPLGTFTVYKVELSSGSTNTDNSPKIKLYPPVPNPVRLTAGQPVKLKFNLPVPNRVELKIYTVTGELVSTLIDTYIDVLGEHETLWYGTNLQQVVVNSGIYIVSLKIGSTVKTQKLAILR